MSKKTTYIILAVIAASVFAIVLFFAVRNTTGNLDAYEGPKTARVGANVIGELSEGYPDVVPLWEGATVISSDRVMRTDFDVYDLTLTTSDDFDDVLNGYLTALQKGGFSIKQRDIGSEMTSIEASTTAHGATFVFFRNELKQTGITASIRTFR